jgi:hypothetical protein
MLLFIFVGHSPSHICTQCGSLDRAATKKLWVTLRPQLTGAALPPESDFAEKETHSNTVFQKHWVFGPYPSSWYKKQRNQGKHDVSEIGSVSVLRCGKNPILLGPLERASPNHWSSGRVSLSLFFDTRTMDRVRKLNVSESYTPSSESYSNY